MARPRRISIDAATCTGHGRCYSLAPELFDADDRGYGVVTSPDVPDELVSRAELALRNCPEGAISLEGSGSVAEVAGEGAR
ncbi:MAG: ferredoxin [Acidimicrobiales bacterium]